MGFGLAVKEEAASEEAVYRKVKQVREVLGELQLPPEVIDQALQKLSEFGGDVDRVADYAISLPNPLVPQVECIEEHLSDDMVSSDEEVEANHAAKEEQWEDPICRLFQDQAAAKDGIQAKDVTEAGCSYQGDISKREMLDISTPLISPTPPASPLAPLTLPPSERQASFLEMGFSFDLVERAFRQHDVDTEDSVILQFLIDNASSAENSVLAPQVNEEDSDDDAELRARVLGNVPFGSLKAPARRLVGTASSDSDSDSEILAMTPCNAWGADPSDSATPSSGGHRTSMYNMGFSPALVEKVYQELGEGVSYDSLMEYLLFVNARQQEASTSLSPPQNGDMISTLQKLTSEFQFPAAAVEKGMSRCDTPLWNASEDDIAVLVDFLAAHMEMLIEDGAITLPDSDESDDEKTFTGEEEDGFEDGFSYWNFPDQGKGKGASSMSSKRKPETSLMGKGKSPAQRGRPRGSLNTTKSSFFRGPEKAPKVLMENKCKGATGFGLPGMRVQSRSLKDDVKGAPFFYFENVASMPKGAWDRIQNHLFGIEPEFVDAMYFSTCRRSRGYIHNLPIEGRKKMLEDPPMTISELMPQTQQFWPEWDKRTKLNCINTVRGSEYCARRQGLVDGTSIEEQELTEEQKKERVRFCSKWNLVWTSPNIATPVEANEIEIMLGFDRDHSRPLLSHTAKFKALGNSFSVFVVAYHFSVLKPLYPNGIKVLSLFSGIGGAEVALHKVGIPLNVVVSVEIEDGPRRILQSWWGSSKQSGILNIDYHDVRDLTREVLTKLVNRYRGFDLIVGGSPCNNFTGNNRVSRTGLEGEHSTMFFEFSRIVSTVRELTMKLQRQR